MKTSKIRFISLLAVATLLVTCFCSTLSVSAENISDTGAPMTTATITFKGMAADGSLGDTDTTLSVAMYNEWRATAVGNGGDTNLSTATDRHVMIADRFAGFSTVNLWSGFNLNTGSNMNWFVVDWDRNDRRFEIVDVYEFGTRAAPVIPHYGFVVSFYKVFNSSYQTEQKAVQAVKAGLDAGNEYVVEVNLDDMVEVIAGRAGSGYEFTCYEEMLFGVKSNGLANIKNGTGSLTEVENITITSADAYDTVAGYSTTHASSRLEFHPTAYNTSPIMDGVALYDSTEAFLKHTKSGLSHYFVLEPVAGKENTYKVSANYVLNTGTWAIKEGTYPTAVPDGGYILVLQHYLSHMMRYRKAYDSANSLANRVAMFQSKNIDYYFAANKEFVIEIKPTVKTIDAGQVRFDNPTGLRFKTQITGWKRMADAGYTLEAGTLIMPKDLLGDTAFTVEALGAENAGKTYLDIKQTKWAVDPTESIDAIGEMNAAIVNIKEGNYGRQFAARGYLKATKDGVTEWYYSDAITYRSVREIADAALADEKCDEKYSEELQKILRGFATPAV